MNLKFLILSFFIFCSIFSHAQNNELKNVINSYSKYNTYSSIHQYHDVSPKSFFVNKFKSDNLEKVYVWRFISNKNHYKGFLFTVYQYETENSAFNKFNDLIKEIRKNSSAETIVPKDWNYVLVVKQYIFQIEGTCTYSEGEWVKLIKSQFYPSIKNNINAPIKGTINSACGGGMPIIR